MTVNAFPEPVLPVEVNFWWNESGPVESYTFDGDSFPYTEPEPISRYVMHTTFINQPTEFFAILTKKQEEEKLEHPHVKFPKGVESLGYLWEFGDGTAGFGAFVTHEYKVVEPGIEVKLTVVDNRGLIWSRAKPVNLVNNITSPYKSSVGFIRSNFSGAPH